MNQNEDILRDALSGIKTKRTRRRITKFDPKDGLLLDIEEGKVYSPGKGIIHIHEVKEKILDCNHSATFGLGHIASCGHTVCALCVERLILECAYHGCFKKLCTVEECDFCAREVEAVYYCREHYLKARVKAFVSPLLIGRTKSLERAVAVIDGYYARRLTLRRE